MSSSPDQIRVVLIGKTGNGKSSTGNSVLYSRTAFQSTQSARSITKECQAKSGQWTDAQGRRREVVVVDTPGFFDPDVTINNQMVERKITSEIFQMTTPGVHAFLIILRIGRFSPEERNTIDFIRTIFGAGAARYCIVIFTHEDQLEEGQSVNGFISSSQELQQLVTSCGNRVLIMNNRLSGQPLERKIQQLLEMIQQMVNNNSGTYYTNAEYQRIEEGRKAEQKKREDEEKRKRFDAEKKIRDDEAKKQNAIISTTTETERREIRRYDTPIMSTERTRKSGAKGLWSHNGSGYNYYEVEIGRRTTITYEERKRL